MLPEPCSRRRVLRTAAGVAAGMVLAGNAVGQDSAPAGQPVPGRPLPARLKLSLAGYSFRRELDTPGKPGAMSLLDLADLCARLDLDAIEPTSYYFLRTDDEWLYRLKSHIFRLGLEISGTPINTNFALPPGPERDAQLAHCRTWVDIAQKLGSPTIRVFAGRPPKTGTREEMFPLVVEGLARSCEYAGSRGIFLAIENHGYLTETADDLLRIVEAVRSPWLGVNLDSGNFHEAPYESFARVAPRAIVCQVKAEVRLGGDRREPTDYHRIVAILRDAGYRGYLALEYEGADPAVRVPIEIRRLQEAVRAAERERT